MSNNKNTHINYSKLIGIIAGLVIFVAAVVGVIMGANTLVDSIFGGKGDGEDTTDAAPVSKPFAYVEIEEGAINSPYAAIYDVENKRIMAGRRTDAKIYPASITKLMTLAVVLDKIPNLDREFIISEDVINYTEAGKFITAGYRAGERVTATDLVHGLIMQSGAECAEALARMIGGSQTSFAKLMNEKAAGMGLTNTAYTNAVGEHNDAHYTTIADMIKLMEHVMNIPAAKNVLTAKSYTSGTSWAHPNGLTMSNHALDVLMQESADIEGKDGIEIIAVKSGFTDQAGRCLITYAAKDGRHFIVVTAMGASSRAAAVDLYTLLNNYIQ